MTEVKEFISKNWVLIIILMTSILVAYISMIFLGKDNIIEQEAEKIIEIESGLKIDLTP